MNLQELLGVELPVIQAPMAGWQGSELAIAVSNAGGLGSLPCALLSVDAIKAELAAIRNATAKPYNVNFFCHTPPVADPKREQAWRELLSPYFKRHGIDPNAEFAAASRTPFTAEAADALAAFKPVVVSLHFGLPAPDLVARVKSWGSKVQDQRRASCVLKSPSARHTALTNLFSGRPARGIVNRLMEDLVPINPAAPAFPLAAGAIAPLRRKAESEGLGDFSPLWAGQNVSGMREISAAALTRSLF